MAARKVAYLFGFKPSNARGLLAGLAKTGGACNLTGWTDPRQIDCNLAAMPSSDSLWFHGLGRLLLHVGSCQQ
jgi:hypothetical protein